MGPAEVVVLLFVWVIPGLLVGHAAQRWGRDRYTWTMSALLLSWVLTLVALLVVGKAKPKTT